MRIAIVADAYPPMQSSGSIMIEHLAVEFIAQGHKPIVIIPDCDINTSVIKSIVNGVEVYRVLCPRTKDVNYLKRTISEF